VNTISYHPKGKKNKHSTEFAVLNLSSAVWLFNFQKISFWRNEGKSGRQIFSVHCAHKHIFCAYKERTTEQHLEIQHMIFYLKNKKLYSEAL